MAQKIDVTFPESVVIGDGWVVEWDAVDPNTGASVSGVIVKEANVTAADLSGGSVVIGGDLGTFGLIPGEGA